LHGQGLEASGEVVVLEHLECPSDEILRARQVGVAQDGGLRQGDQGSALRPAVAGALCGSADLLHLAGDGGQVAQKGGGLRREVTAAQRGMQLGRAQQEVTGGAVRLPRKCALPSTLERGGGLALKLLGRRAVELGQELGRMVEVIGTDLEQLLGGALL
jgi:hypothetical protein